MSKYAAIRIHTYNYVYTYIPSTLNVVAEVLSMSPQIVAFIHVYTYIHLDTPALIHVYTPITMYTHTITQLGMLKFKFFL